MRRPGVGTLTTVERGSPQRAGSDCADPDHADPDQAELYCVVERQGGAAVVRVAGHLAPSTAPVLRATVLGCLVDEPDVVVLDVAGMRLCDEVVLTVFPALARHAAAWPGSRMSLAGAPPPLASALGRMAVDRQVPLFPSTEAAVADRAGPGAGHRRTVRLLPSLDATHAARHLVHQACRDWGVERIAALAELIATELTSNVVRHAGTAMEVGVSRRGRLLHLSVRDRSTDPPRLGASADSLREEGRGLFVVEALSWAWGWTPTTDGKVVWASLDTHR